jgi:AcrR family transcriptional regulator
MSVDRKNFISNLLIEWGRAGRTIHSTVLRQAFHSTSQHTTRSWNCIVDHSYDKINSFLTVLMGNRSVSKSPIAAGRSRGRPPRSEERRLEILEAFARCVARRGLEATTLDDVAREAGLQRAMIRHYVGNRDTLVREALEHLSAQYLARAAEALDALGNALDVDAMLDFFFLGDYVFGMPEQNRVFDSLLFAAANDPQACASLRAVYESIDELVRKHLVHFVPSAEPDRIGPVAWAIVCLAEQNIMMLGLGAPPRRSQELRDIARALVDSIG